MGIHGGMDGRQQVGKWRSLTAHIHFSHYLVGTCGRSKDSPSGSIKNLKQSSRTTSYCFQRYRDNFAATPAWHRAFRR